MKGFKKSIYICAEVIKNDNKNLKIERSGTSKNTIMMDSSFRRSLQLGLQRGPVEFPIYHQGTFTGGTTSNPFCLGSVACANAMPLAPHEKHSNDGTHEDSTSQSSLDWHVPTSSMHDFPFKHPWEERYIYRNTLIPQKNQRNVGKYTVRPMDPLGFGWFVATFTKRLWAFFQKIWDGHPTSNAQPELEIRKNGPWCFFWTLSFPNPFRLRKIWIGLGSRDEKPSEKKQLNKNYNSDLTPHPATVASKGLGWDSRYWHLD